MPIDQFVHPLTLVINVLCTFIFIFYLTDVIMMNILEVSCSIGIGIATLSNLQMQSVRVKEIADK